MNILITTPYPIWPVNFGGATRTFNIAQSLSSIGHNITLLSPEPITQNYNQIFQWSSYQQTTAFDHFWNPSFYKQLKFILKNNYDLIIMSFPYQAFMVLQQAKAKNIPVIYDAHNVEKDRFLSMGNPLKSLPVGLTENFLGKKAKAILAVSEEDKLIFQSRYTVPVDILPNGVDLESFYYAQANKELLAKYNLTDKKVVLYFGTFSYEPNIEAVKYLVEKIWPKVTANNKDTVLLIVGKNPPSWLTSSENIVVTGLVDNIVEHIQLAQIVAVPLFSGGGSRLKIIEALACGKTVLSTEFGATGIPENNKGGLILTNIEFFSEKLIELLKTTDNKINQSSRNIAINFGWVELVKQINWRKLRKGKQK